VAKRWSATKRARSSAFSASAMARKLKSVAAKVMRHEADRAAIPEIARTMKAHLALLQKDSELAKAF